MSLLRVGDPVMYRGNHGSGVPVLTTIKGIQIGVEDDEVDTGEMVNAIDWKHVDDTVIVDLDNGHWGYGSQITKVNA